MRLSTAAVNAMLDSFAGIALHLSLHTGYPGDAGSNEAVAGTGAGQFPSYARQPLTGGWAAASSALVQHTATSTFTIGSGTGTGGTLHFIGYWSAATAGTFYGFAPLGGKQALFVQENNATLASVIYYNDNQTSVGGVANDAQVWLRLAGPTGAVTTVPDTGDFPGAGIDNTATRYYIVGTTGRSGTEPAKFGIATTQGGSAVAFDSSSGGTRNLVAQVVVPETITASGGSLAITTKSIRGKY